jgi:2-keto-4-pentenoate hydratase/2-oxohepta-3-ene-1,7-dioic acid hydratase in catechol pathway
MYQHQDFKQQFIDLPVKKVVCVGRNYLDHIAELDSDIPEDTLLFLKPEAAMCDMAQPLMIPTHQGECHNELEVAILLKSPLVKVSPHEVESAIWGVGLGLDLTLRTMQNKLKKQGHPWERAKSFDLSCPLSGFVPLELVANIKAQEFTLRINDEVRQQGNTAMMMGDIYALIAEISQHFSLAAGDVILTGTPKGVGPMYDGDKVNVRMPPYIDMTTQVVSA